MGDRVFLSSRSSDGSGEGKEIGHEVPFSLNVLGGETGVGRQDDVGAVTGCFQVSPVGRPLGAKVGGAVEPADGRSAVTERQDTDLVVRLAVEALKPDVDDHSNEFKKVVDFAVSVQDAEVGDRESPRPSRGQEEAADSERARVGPVEPVGLASHHQVHGDARVGLSQEPFPEDEVVTVVAVRLQPHIFMAARVFEGS